MTFPAIFYRDGFSHQFNHQDSSSLFILGYREKSLLTVAIGTCLAAFAANLILSVYLNVRMMAYRGRQ